MVEFNADQQAHIDTLIGNARVKAREKAETELQKFKDDQVEANLVANEEWQTLAQTHEARVKELEPLEAKVAEYNTLLEGMLNDRVKEMGDKAKSALKSLPESMTSVERLNWLNKNSELFQPVGDGVGSPNRPEETQKKPQTDSNKPMFSL